MRQIIEISFFSFFGQLFGCFLLSHQRIVRLHFCLLDSFHLLFDFVLVSDVLSHFLAFLLHFAVFVLASFFGLFDGLQSLAFGLFFFLFGALCIISSAAAQIFDSI